MGHCHTILVCIINNKFLFLSSYLMQAAISCGSEEVEGSIESSVDNGCGGSVAERESGHRLLAEGILDLQPTTSSAG